MSVSQPRCRRSVGIDNRDAGVQSTGPMPAWLAVLFFAGIGIIGIFSMVYARVTDGPTPLGEQAAGLLTHFAVLVAGRRRLYLLDAWNGDLAGTPEEHRPLTPDQQLRYSRRCLWAALRLRCGDLLDGVLASNRWCPTLGAAVISTAAVVLWTRGGAVAVWNGLGNLAILGGLLTATVKCLRTLRGIQPTPRSARNNHDPD